MPNPLDLTSVNGLHVQIQETADGRLIYQPIQPDGEPFFFNRILSPSGALDFAAAPMKFSGFEVVWLQSAVDAGGQAISLLRGDAITEDGSVSPNISITLGDMIAPQIQALYDGDYVVQYDTIDSHGVGTAHVRLGNFSGLFTDTTVASRPDSVVEANGTFDLVWNGPGGTEREVLDHNGNVLAGRAVSHEFDVSNAGSTVIQGFNLAHDQLLVANADGTVAGGSRSTLTFDARDHSLTWDQDSEGPLPAHRFATLDAGQIGVANLADSFRPAVLKVIAGDGSSTITWFDTDHSQSWDTLVATEDAAGNVLTYAANAIGGTSEVFHFDVGDTQAYQRYVDDLDITGHVVNRTVLYDDGSSWSARYLYQGGEVAEYELINYDAAGHMLAHGFYSPDGVLLDALAV